MTTEASEVLRDRILSLVQKHETWRADCLNLVAAENAMSPLARSLLASDLAQRYGDYTGRDLHARHYFGTPYVVELEMLVNDLAREVFGAEYVELRPISGHTAGNCVIMSMCRPGDLALELGRHEGGHRLATKLATSPLIDLKVEFLPFDDGAFNVDVERTLEVVKAKHPRLIIVGASNFLFPVPLRALADGLRGTDTILAYDASHVLGLVAGGAFQAPLAEGAHLVLAGTQKSFPGPQGGVIYSDQPELIQQISDVVYPAILSNHHLAHLASLGIALLEMKQYGPAYASTVIENARALAQALVDEGLSVVGNGQRYTDSHSVLLQTADLGNNQALGHSLEEAGIIVTAIRLPVSLGGEGLRLGTNELTRRGVDPDGLRRTAALIADTLLQRRSPQDVRRDVLELADGLKSVAYTWAEIDPTSAERPAVRHT